MATTEIETFCPASVKDWRQWLKKYHSKKQCIWLICYKKETGKPTLSWSDAVDQALCYGWIDGTRKSVDHESFMQYFSRRKPNSMWSKINKNKVEKLIADGQMTQAGLNAIEIAKENGSWTILDDVEELVIPKDLENAFKTQPGSKPYFMSLSKSVKKMILHWVTVAKRPETREKRITEVVTLAAKQQRHQRFM
ncbi:MAG: YdeI/OmpD-associated family protein [Flavipsychrobacter sp.]|nr:YdeI/OmpD-associated family protein [Flavipsychrobacter sp.]